MAVHLTPEDRFYIEKRRAENISARMIAQELGRSPSTIYRENPYLQKLPNTNKKHSVFIIPNIMEWSPHPQLPTMTVTMRERRTSMTITTIPLWQDSCYC